VQTNACKQIQLIGSDKEHCKAKETEKDPKTLAPAKRLERNLERLKAQERYYDVKIESLQSFLRLCTRVRKSMVRDTGTAILSLQHATVYNVDTRP
jgi:hypothetical protein